MGTHHKNIAVVGGGVNGLSCAYRLISEGYADPKLVTLISEEFSPNTTGDGSAGFLMPFGLGEDAPVSSTNKWMGETWQYLEALQSSLGPDDPRLVKEIPTYEMSPDPTYTQNPAPWAAQLRNYRQMTNDELAPYRAAGARCGFFYVTLGVNVQRYLPYLLNKFSSLGGKVVQKRIQSLEELYNQYDIIINCTGLDAYNLANDKTVFPGRGQVVRVVLENGADRALALLGQGSVLYILPGFDGQVTLGGCKDLDWNRDVDEAEKARILAGTAALQPSLLEAKHLEDWVGLRPCRPSVRIEREMFRKGTKSIHVIHNYGHGGSGVTLFWGCASDVLQLVRQCYPISRL